MTLEIIDASKCSLTYFKGKFTENVINVSKNHTIFSLDSKKV